MNAPRRDPLAGPTSLEILAGILEDLGENETIIIRRGAIVGPPSVEVIVEDWPASAPLAERFRVAHDARIEDLRHGGAHYVAHMLDTMLRKARRRGR